MLLSVAPLLVGVQMLLYALMLDIQESPDQPMTIDYRRMAEASANMTVQVLSAETSSPRGQAAVDSAVALGPSEAARATTATAPARAAASPPVG